MGPTRLLLLFAAITAAGMVTRTESSPPISRNEAYAELEPADGSTAGTRVFNPSGITDRIVTGYQGWFRAPGDGSQLGFQHYQKRGRFIPGQCTIDLWPDLTEFGQSEKFATEFRHADGSTAHVFSSIHPQTIDRHFRWMQEYEIDGAFVQRFAVHGAKTRNDYRSLKFENRKLIQCRDAAIRHSRCWVLMYDLSGLHDDDFDRLAEDWKQLRRKMNVGTDPGDSSYLHVNGKPLVAIWGVGFGDDREYSLEKTEWFIRLLKHNPEWGGMSIMLGVPYHWRQQRGDATKHEDLHQVLKLADILSPWSVGRYRSLEHMSDIRQHQEKDLHWCIENQIEYLPVLWPGFSWQNLKGETSSEVPRLGGRFLWHQFQATVSAGNRTAYIAMFDEIDEGTAIFKCTNSPPVGASSFKTYEGLPSDHYLWLCREGRRLLRGEIPTREESR